MVILLFEFSSISFSATDEANPINYSKSMLHILSEALTSQGWC